MQIPAFDRAVQAAVASGLAAAAILDHEGRAIALAGALDDDEARALAAVITRRMRALDPLARMIAGEMISTPLDDREVQIGIVERCVFVVVVYGATPASSAVDVLRDTIEQAIHEIRSGSSRPWARGPGGGSGSGPAALPVIELGVTVPRKGRN